LQRSIAQIRTVKYGPIQLRVQQERSGQRSEGEIGFDQFGPQAAAWRPLLVQAV
jgi:hypothetical protein